MPKKKTQEQFISDAHKVHGIKYDYSKAEYRGANKRICIICPEHGEFWQIASGHLRGAGCPLCVHERQRLGNSLFIAKAKIVFGDKYDYSKVDYRGNKDKVCVICREHGEFWVTPNNHLRGSECPTCYGTPKKTTEQFIAEARKTHGNKYDYSKVDYKGGKKKVCIICPEHGEFWQNPFSHIKGSQCPACSGTERISEDVFFRRAPIIHEHKYDYSKVKFTSVNDFVTIICPVHGEYEQRVKVHMRGYGCPYCGGSKRLTTEEFIEKANEVHEGRYDYSKAKYINTSTKLCIICPDHGEFWQTPNNHLFGAGCPKCAGKYNDREFFIERAKKVHGDKYNYSKVEYVATDEKVCIVCPQHGEFWQTPSGHMHGQGCPMCNQSHIERDVMHFLSSQKIKFVAQKTFDWLIGSRTLRLDFFLPDYGIAIECQGGQHFTAVDYYGGEEGLKCTQERDTLKKKLCEEHGITVLYYSDLRIAFPYFVFEDLGQLLEAIKENGQVDASKWTDPELPLLF